MNGTVSRLQFVFRSSSRHALVLGLGISLTAYAAAFAQQETPPLTTPPVAAPPAEPSAPPPPPPPVATPAQRPEIKQVAEAPQPTKIAPIIVTGSLIPTAETVGAAPVDTISAADIAKTGAQDVLSLVKKLSPTFYGAGNVGQTLNNGGVGEAYAQIHNLRTLVLIDGHRLGNSALSETTFLGQNFVDLNTIPMAAIERIEILKDGSSALYGSEAVGGVINIILKKDFTGVELDGRYGAATGKGSFTEQRASVVTGVRTDDSSFMAGAEYYHQDPLLAKDRSVASLSLQARVAKGLGAPTYFSNSYPGRTEDADGKWILANSPFAKGADGYNPGLLGGPAGTTAGSPPIVPGFSILPNQTNAVSAYNTAAIANGYVDPTGHGLGPYLFMNDLPLVQQVGSRALLNTTLYGPPSIQQQDRRQAFFKSEHDLIGKELQLVGEFLYAHNESQGGLAPSPVPSLYDSNIFISSNNVYNPFGIDLGPPGTNSVPAVRSRFIQSGPRIFDSQTDFFHATAGFKGSFDSGYTYDTAYNYNRYDQLLRTKNAINGAALDLALQPNPDPVLAAQGLSKLQQFGAFGPFLPIYNFFFSPTQDYPTTQGANSPELIRAISTSLFESGVSEEWDVGGVITGHPFELSAGKIGFAAGGGIESDSLNIDFDGLTKLGKVPGLTVLEPTSGTRNSYNLFAEVRIPLTSPDMNIPGFRSLEVTAAGRFESIDPGGDDLVPKVAIRWQPLDEEVTLRASYSESFIAPTTGQLFGGDIQTTPTLVLQDFPEGIQESTVAHSNPDLKAVKAENYSFGIVISPKAIPHLTVSADYFHVQTRNDIFIFGANTMMADLEKNGSNSQFNNLYVDIHGNHLSTTASNQITSLNYGLLSQPQANGAKIQTEGVDLAANYVVPTKEIGDFSFYVAANVLFKYLYSDPIFGGPFHYEGQYTDLQVVNGAQNTLPDYQINTGVTWDFQNFTYNINARYVPPVIDKGDGFPANNNSGFTASGKNWTVESWFDIDMQLAYEFGRHEAHQSWYGGTKVTVGINNVTDEKPPLISSSSEDSTDKAVYDIVGRFVYVQVSKRF
jgi:iron complex outermembrane receptor protein